MTAQLKLAEGAANAPALTFASDLDTGVYHVGSGQFAFVSNGSIAYTINSDLSVTFAGSISVAGTVAFSGAITFGGIVAFSAGVSGPLLVFDSGSTALTLNRTENDTSNRTFMSMAFGNRSGVGVNFNGVGGGANNVATFQLASSTGTDLLDIDPVTQIITIPGFLNINNYADFTQIASPAAPSAGKNRLYFKSDGFAYQNNGTVERQVGSLVFIGEFTPAGVANQDIPIPAGCQALIIEAVNWVNAGSVNVVMTFSQDNGATFLAGTNYSYAVITLITTTVSGSDGNGVSSIVINNSAASVIQQFEIKLMKPLASGLGGVAGFWRTGLTGTGFIQQYGSFRLSGSSNAITTVRLAPATGNITSATIRAYMET